MIKKDNIYLIGFSGTGKSTVGPILAEKLNREYVELDGLIEEEMGLCVSDIFGILGEPAFRNIEHGLLKSLARKKGLIVDTGGGVPAEPRNIPLLKRGGLIIGLQSEISTLIQRTKGDTTRPLLKSPESLQALWNQRRNAYTLAHLTYDTGAMTLEELVELMMEDILRWEAGR